MGVVCGVCMDDLQDGWTALMYAAVNGHDAVFKTLLKSGATMDMANQVNDQPNTMLPRWRSTP